VKGKEGPCQSSEKKNNDVMSFQTMLVYEIDLFFLDEKLLPKKVKQTYKRVLLSLSSNQFEFKVLLPRDPLSKQTSGQNPFVKIVAIFILEVLFHP